MYRFLRIHEVSAIQTSFSERSHSGNDDFRHLKNEHISIAKTSQRKFFCYSHWGHCWNKARAKNGSCNFLFFWRTSKWRYNQRISRKRKIKKAFFSTNDTDSESSGEDPPLNDDSFFDLDNQTTLNGSTDKSTITDLKEGSCVVVKYGGNLSPSMISMIFWCAWTFHFCHYQTVFWIYFVVLHFSLM